MATPWLNTAHLRQSRPDSGLDLQVDGLDCLICAVFTKDLVVTRSAFRCLPSGGGVHVASGLGAVARRSSWDLTEGLCLGPYAGPRGCEILMRKVHVWG